MSEFTQMTKLQKGFGLFEMIIVLSLLAGLGAMVVPNLFRSQTTAARKEFLSSFRDLLQHAVLHAVYENKTVQVYINVESEKIQLRQFDEQVVEENKHKKFSEIKADNFKPYISLPSSLSIKNFVINETDEVRSQARLQEVWFYIMPDGTSQPVIVNMIDRDDREEKDIPFSFVINPFYARMSSYEGFQELKS